MVDTNAPDKKRGVCAIVIGELKQARMRGARWAARNGKEVETRLGKAINVRNR